MTHTTTRGVVSALVDSADARQYARHGIHETYVDAKVGAPVLGISPRHLLRLAARREVASYRLSAHAVRFKVSDLQKYAEKHRVGELRERS